MFRKIAGLLTMLGSLTLCSSSQAAAQANEGPGALNVALVDAKTDEVLARVFAPAPGQRIFHRIQIPIAAWRGRTVRLVARDENAGGGLGWIGIRDVVLTGKQ